MKKTKLTKRLAKQGYTVLQGPHADTSSWSELLQNQLNDFQQGWNNLPEDNFLSDGGHYRFRRYSVFSWSNKSNTLTLLPHEPHYQSTYRNNMNGGVFREFEPFTDETVNNHLLSKMIQFISINISFNDEKKWRIQAHQFRIKANNEEAGLPTPEGIHRDGADFILIMVLKRHNISGGINHIYDKNKCMVFGAILDQPGDALLINDQMVWHGVSEIYPVDIQESGYRDVLVLTFHNDVNA